MAQPKPNTSTQDILPDINYFYTTIIQEIDRFRSRRNSSSTTDIFANISLTKLEQVLVIDNINSIYPQESRCNAFYRMIGFPVVSPDGSAYSPGFNPDVNRDVEKQQERLGIANRLLEGIGSVLNNREQYPKDQAVIFNQTDARATSLAINSIFVRNFGKQFKDGLQPLDKDPQTFQIADRTKDFNLSTHILKPFVGDPRIELTVAPAANRICAPFLTDKSKTQLSKGQYLKRPYIEKVIRVRLNKANVVAAPTGKDESGQYLRDLLANIQSDPKITSAALTDVLANPSSSLHSSEIVVYEKFVRILESLVTQLVKAINDIGRIRTNINWKPIPNINGPEFGSELNAPDRSDPDNLQKENDINKAELIKVVGQTDLDVGVSDADLGDFIFSDLTDTALNATQHNYKFYDDQLKTLNNKRNEDGNKANELLRQIEIITGEFSGLGLLDVIAIQAALWIIPQNTLLGLIDSDAIGRMETNKNLQSGIGPSASLQALTEFEQKLSEIYILIEAFYQNIIDANGVNSQ